MDLPHDNNLNDASQNKDCPPQSTNTSPDMKLQHSYKKEKLQIVILKDSIINIFDPKDELEKVISNECDKVEDRKDEQIICKEDNFDKNDINNGQQKSPFGNVNHISSEITQLEIIDLDPSEIQSKNPPTENQSESVSDVFEQKNDSLDTQWETAFQNSPISSTISKSLDQKWETFQAKEKSIDNIFNENSGTPISSTSVLIDKNVAAKIEIEEPKEDQEKLIIDFLEFNNERMSDNILDFPGITQSEDCMWEKFPKERPSENSSQNVSEPLLENDCHEADKNADNGIISNEKPEPIIREHVDNQPHRNEFILDGIGGDIKEYDNSPRRSPIRRTHLSLDRSPIASQIISLSELENEKDQQRTIDSELCITDLDDDAFFSPVVKPKPRIRGSLADANQPQICIQKTPNFDASEQSTENLLKSNPSEIKLELTDPSGIQGNELKPEGEVNTDSDCNVFNTPKPLPRNKFLNMNAKPPDRPLHPPKITIPIPNSSPNRPSSPVCSLYDGSLDEEIYIGDECFDKVTVKNDKSKKGKIKFGKNILDKLKPKKASTETKFHFI